PSTPPYTTLYRSPRRPGASPRPAGVPTRAVPRRQRDARDLAALRRWRTALPGRRLRPARGHDHLEGNPVPLPPRTGTCRTRTHPRTAHHADPGPRDPHPGASPLTAAGLTA